MTKSETRTSFVIYHNKKDTESPRPPTYLLDNKLSLRHVQYTNTENLNIENKLCLKDTPYKQYEIVAHNRHLDINYLLFVLFVVIAILGTLIVGNNCPQTPPVFILGFSMFVGFTVCLKDLIDPSIKSVAWAQLIYEKEIVFKRKGNIFNFPKSKLATFGREMFIKWEDKTFPDKVMTNEKMIEWEYVDKRSAFKGPKYLRLEEKEAQLFSSAKRIFVLGTTNPDSNKTKPTSKHHKTSLACDWIREYVLVFDEDAAVPIKLSEDISKKELITLDDDNKKEDTLSKASLQEKETTEKTLEFTSEEGSSSSESSDGEEYVYRVGNFHVNWPGQKWRHSTKDRIFKVKR